MSDEADILAHLAELEARWNANAMDRMAELWDQDEASPLYQAEEEELWCSTWPALEDYWRRTRVLNEDLRLTYGPISVHKIAPDLAHAAWTMRWAIKLKTYAKPLGGDNRVFAILRRTAKGWRLIAYIEAPLAPITYIRKFYEREGIEGLAAAKT